MARRRLRQGRDSAAQAVTLVRNAPYTASAIRAGIAGVERGDAAHLAAVHRVVERARPVHGGAVVPNQEVPFAPRVPVHQRRPGRVLHEVAQQEPAVRHRPVEDARRVRGKVEGAPPGARVLQHQRLERPLEPVALVVRELEAERHARVRDRMVHAQAPEARLRLVRQRVVGGAHVRELGIGRDLRQHEGGQHRVAAARVLKRRVGVPEAVRDAVLALAVVRRQERAVRTHVGDVGERLVAEAALVQHADAGLTMKLAVEPGGERELLLARERLVAKDEHRVLVHARPDPLERRRVVDGAEIDCARLGGEHGVELAEA